MSFNKFDDINNLNIRKCHLLRIQEFIYFIFLTRLKRELIDESAKDRSDLNK